MWLSMHDLDRRWPCTIVMLVAPICSGSMHTDQVDRSICHVSIVSNGFRLRVDIPSAEWSLAFRDTEAKS
jgi:hypothetical protein